MDVFIEVKIRESNVQTEDANSNKEQRGFQLIIDDVDDPDAALHAILQALLHVRADLRQAQQAQPEDYAQPASSEHPLPDLSQVHEIYDEGYALWVETASGRVKLTGSEAEAMRERLDADRPAAHGSETIRMINNDEIVLRKNLNRVELVGQLQNYPEARYDEMGIPRCTFLLRTEGENEDALPGHQPQHTEWHWVATRDRFAEMCGALDKNALVYVEGHLVRHFWQDTMDEEHSRTEIEASNVIVFDVGSS